MAVKYLLAVLLLTIIAIAKVKGHAVLITPTPLNTNPVTRLQCGVETMPTGNNRKPSATWLAGSRQTINWKLIASDGGSAVTGLIDPKGGTDFTVQAWTGTIPHGTTVGQTYEIGFTLPPSLTQCDPVCTFQVRSNVNNWVSCTFINITNCADCPPPPPAPAQCKDAGDLSFCTMRNDKNVLIPADFTPTQQDQNARLAYNTYIVNPNVFRNNGTNCRDKFKELLCSINLPPCPGSGQTQSNYAACHATCETAMEACEVTDSHKLLYDCDALPLCNGETSSASFSSSSFAAAAALSAATAAALLN